jgi:exosortase
MVDDITSSIAEGAHFAGFPFCCKSQDGIPAENRKMALQSHRTSAPLKKQWWPELGLHNYIKILIIGGLVCYLFRIEIRQVVGQWLTDSSWSHGFLIPLFSLYFVNQKREQILNLQTRPNYLGLLLLLLAIAFYVANRFSPSGYEYFCRASIIATIGAIVLFLGGWRLIKYTWLPIAYLIFAVPLPYRYYRELTIPMRQWAATVASGLLNLVPELEASNINPVTGLRSVVIEVFYKGTPLDPPLDVAEACSGMRLLMAFLALGVAMAYLHHRPFWQRMILLATTVPIAIFCNVVRVTATGFIYILIHPKYAQGIYHDMLGMAMLPLAFGLYGFLAWFMSSLFVDESRMITEDVVVRTRDA